MSVSKRAIRLTPRARRDYERILLSSRRVWGENQSLVYQSAIARVIDLLGDHPQVGRPRDDLLSGCRSIQVEQHVIYYQPRASEIAILRILHHRQDASTLVGDPRLSGPGTP
jgi:toxin ParE1/3/4